MRTSLFFWLYCIVFLPLEVSGQNLIPNGGFEELRNPSCVDPTNAFEFSDTWYVLDATPDLFLGNCPLDESGSFFWDKTIDAYKGRNFAGLSSRWNSNATYVSEGIAVHLSQALEAGVTYYFQVAILNRGGYQGFDEDVSSCNLRPTKHIDIYLSEDSIQIENNFSNGTASTNGLLVARLEDEVITSRIPSQDWQLVSTCFKAQGGEEYLALVMPLGSFGDLPPCAAQSTSGVFRSFYYHLDELELRDTPEEIEVPLQMCEGEQLDVDLVDLLDQPILEDATFTWADGVQATQRTLDQEGLFFINAELTCGSIPIILNVETLACTPNVYMPNAFSPNGDGINDELQPFIETTGTIVRYQLEVFNRWGALVFESENPQEAWKGTTRGQELLAGYYLWNLLLEVETLEGSQVLNRTGEILLLK